MGVGPGDPSLLTLAAVEAIQAATIIAYPVSNNEDKGIAASIASKWITQDKSRMPLVFPMVLEEETLQHAWRQASEKLVSAVNQGNDVVYLCQGDISLFASGSYVLLDVQSNCPKCEIRLIPGVTSFAAAAALAAWPLAMQREQLLILPTPDDPKRLDDLLDQAAAERRILALLKLGHRWQWVRPLLERKMLLKEALFAQKIGFADQEIMPAIEVEKKTASYFSLLLVRQSWPEVVPGK